MRKSFHTLSGVVRNKIGVSPTRINDYVTGRAEPTLKVARLLCATLGIAPALILGM